MNSFQKLQVLLFVCLALSKACRPSPPPDRFEKHDSGDEGETSPESEPPEPEEEEIPTCQTTYKGRNDSSRCYCNGKKICREGTVCVMTRGSGYLENICVEDYSIEYVRATIQNCEDVQIDFYYRPIQPLCICGQLGVCAEGEYCYAPSKHYCLKDFTSKEVELQNPAEFDACTEESVAEKERCNCEDIGECPQGFVCDLSGKPKCVEDPTLEQCTQEVKTGCRCVGNNVCPGGYVCDAFGDFFSCISERKDEMLQAKEELENEKYQEEMEEAEERARQEAEEQARRDEEERTKREEEERLRKEVEEGLAEIQKQKEEEEARQAKELEERLQKEKEEAAEAAERVKAEAAEKERARVIEEERKKVDEKQDEKKKRKEKKKKNKKTKKSKKSKKAKKGEGSPVVGGVEETL